LVSPSNSDLNFNSALSLSFFPTSPFIFPQHKTLCSCTLHFRIFISGIFLFIWTLALCISYFISHSDEIFFIFDSGVLLTLLILFNQSLMPMTKNTEVHFSLTAADDFGSSVSSVHAELLSSDDMSEDDKEYH